MSDKAIKRISRKEVFSSRWITVYNDQILRSNGERGEYAVVERNDFVILVLVSPSGRLLMLENHRYPTGRTSLEIPLGSVDPGETPARAAARELREETGLTDVSLTEIGHYYSAPGLSDQQAFVFQATITDQLMKTAETPDTGEEIESAQAVSVHDIPGLFAEERISDAATLMGLSLAGIRIAPVKI